MQLSRANDFGTDRKAGAPLKQGGRGTGTGFAFVSGPPG